MISLGSSTSFSVDHISRNPFLLTLSGASLVNTFSRPWNRDVTRLCLSLKLAGGVFHFPSGSPENLLLSRLCEVPNQCAASCTQGKWCISSGRRVNAQHLCVPSCSQADAQRLSEVAPYSLLWKDVDKELVSEKTSCRTLWF